MFNILIAISNLWKQLSTKSMDNVYFLPFCTQSFSLFWIHISHFTINWMAECLFSRTPLFFCVINSINIERDHTVEQVDYSLICWSVNNCAFNRKYDKLRIQLTNIYWLWVVVSTCELFALSFELWAMRGWEIQVRIHIQNRKKKSLKPRCIYIFGIFNPT